METEIKKDKDCESIQNNLINDVSSKLPVKFSLAEEESLHSWHGKMPHSSVKVINELSENNNFGSNSYKNETDFREPEKNMHSGKKRKINEEAIERKNRLTTRSNSMKNKNVSENFSPTRQRSNSVKDAADIECPPHFAANRFALLQKNAHLVSTEEGNQRSSKELSQLKARRKIFQISPASISPMTVSSDGILLSPRNNFRQLLPPINEMAASRKCSTINEIQNAITHPIDEEKLMEESIECERKQLESDDTGIYTKDQGEKPTISNQKSNYDTIYTRNYDTLTTRNYDTLNAFPGSTCESNSTTMERPPNINAYRMTIVKAINSRASMLQLMHRKSAQQSEISSIRTPSTIYPSSISDATLSGLDDGTSGFEKFSPALQSKNAKFMFSSRSTGINSMQNGNTLDNVKLERKRIHSAFEPKNFFDAVYIPVFTNIVGTLLYIRMGYVTGQAGILGGIAIVLFSTLVIGVTAISLSAICSNGKQLKGGAYYVISRSLGPQVGGVIAVIFSLANVGMAALYIVGVAEFTSDLLIENEIITSYFTDCRQNDIRILSVALCILLMLIIFAGPDIENRFTLVFFSTYFISYFNWTLGTFLPVGNPNALRGVTGYNWITVKMNLYPAFRKNESFITTFAVFFPGFTGMLAGVMYVDQLKNPGTDVASGLFTSLATTTVMYVLAVIACGATMLRDASGFELPFIDENTGYWHIENCTYTESCRYGLMNYYQVAELTSAWRPLIIIGMFGMTISSTMTNLNQGPQNLQAACKDGILGRTMTYFGKVRGLAQLPLRAYILLSILTIGLTLIGDLNALNGIVTNMFMAIYILVNYACFDASFVRSPGWRPEFAYYNMWVSLFGAGLSLVVMFFVSIESCVIICIMFGAFLAYFHYFHPEVDWGDSYQAHLYKDALHNLLKLSSTEVHVKNYRPQILLLSGNPAARLPLLDFAHSITKGDSLLFCAHVVKYPINARMFGLLLQLETEMEKWLRNNKIKCFYQNLASENFRGGVAHVLQMAGLGRLRPNVLLIGFKSDWRTMNPAKDALLIDDYVGVIRDAFENNYGVMILRNGTDGFDLSAELEKYDVRDVATLRTNADAINKITAAENGLTTPRRKNTLISNTSEINMAARKRSLISFANRGKLPATSKMFYSDKHFFEENNGEDIDNTELSETTLRRSRSETIGMSDRIRTRLEQNVVALNDLSRRVNIFRKSHAIARHAATRRIDVWWLYDDGGLTLLIPHLLRMPKSYLEGAELRIITLSGMGAEVDEASIVALLVKFRIEFSVVKVIDVTKHKLKTEIWQEFATIIRPWRLSKQQNKKDCDQEKQKNEFQRGLIMDSELQEQRRKTYRQLLTGQLLRQYSSTASIIVLTLTIPNEFISSCLYMAWLDAMSRDLPPILFVRGNQTSVLTFYS